MIHIQNVIHSASCRLLHLPAVVICTMLAYVLGAVTPDQASATSPQHGIAMHGAPQLPRDFRHLPYVNPDAPKGGRITIGVFGTFDSLNPMIVRGVTPNDIRGLVYESLLERNRNEPFSLYGLIAQSVELPDDRRSITFNLNPAAAFSDGRRITASDVIFSWEMLRKYGRPYMRSHYGKVERISRHSARRVTFHFKAGADREIALIVGLMPVLPRHAIDPETFNRPTLKPPLGSGPYRITRIEAGKTLTYKRNQDYWARDLPIRRGLFNADEYRLMYFRDGTAMFEAFKSGQLDFREEKDPGRWVSGYDFPAIREGRVKRHAFPLREPAGMTGLVFNTRKPKFKDQRVRQALIHAFDARAVNRQLFHDKYVRSLSFFARSGLAAHGTPASSRERVLLADYPELVKAEIMAGGWHGPTSDGGPGNRKNLRTAYNLLHKAGYVLKNGGLVDGKTGKPFEIEFLVLTRSQARIAVAYAETLKRLGIKPVVRQVEDTQYWARTGNFDFDIIQWTYTASLSPGNEQIHRWHSAYANVPRSFNFAGVRNPAVDAMIDALLKTRTRENFVAAVRALDRVLLSGDYLIPLFHLPEMWIAATTRLAFPDTKPLFGTDMHMWWVRPSP